MSDPALQEAQRRLGVPRMGINPAPTPTNGGVVEQSLAQYPILKDFSFTVSPADTSGRQLESWVAGEPGDEKYARPKSLPLDKPGIEILSEKTRPIDVIGDAVSHVLVKTDPTLKNYYDTFIHSMTPQQQGMLRQQYEHARQNEGEKRTFEDWAEISGIPAYFRGYAFQQWPKEFTDKAYTPEQRQMFDGMMKYLSGAKE